MANKSLGTLTVDVIAKTGGLEAGMDKAARESKKRSDAIEKHWNNVGQAIGRNLRNVSIAAAGAVAAVATSTAIATREFANYSKEISTFASISSLSVESFQEYARAAGSVGISNEKLADQMKDVNERIGEYITTGKGPLTDFINNFGKSAGVTAKQLQDLNDPLKALQLIVKTMQDQGASKNEMSFVLESLASDTTNLIPLLRDGAAGLEDFANKFKSVGVLSQEEISRGIEVGNAITVLTEKYDTLKNKIIAELAPSILDLIDNFDSMFDAAGENGASKAVSTLATAIDLVGVASAGAQAFVQHLTTQVSVLTSVAMTAFDLVKNLAGLNLGTVISEAITKGPEQALSNLQSRATGLLTDFRRNMTMNQAIVTAEVKKSGEAIEEVQRRANAAFNGGGVERARREAERAAERAKQATDAQVASTVRLNEEERKLAQDKSARQQRELANANAAAQLVGETSKLRQLEIKIQNGLIEGDEKHLNALREAAKLEDKNRAALESRRESMKGVSSAASRMNKELENEAKKRLQEAERLKEAYDRQVNSMERQLYMIGKSGESAAISWSITNGEFKNYSDEQKKHLVDLAQQIDLTEKAHQSEVKLRNEAADRMKEQADYMKNINENYSKYISNLQLETSLMGKTRQEIEYINTLRDFGVSKESATGQEIKKNLDMYYAQEKAVSQQVEVMDELRQSASSSLKDVLSGTKSIGDAFTSILDNVHDRILSIISDNMIESLFGGFGSNDGGKAGGGISGFLGNLFGVNNNVEKGGATVTPFNPETIEQLKSEAQRMTDGVIAVHTNAANQIAVNMQNVGETANTGILGIADSASNNMQAAVGATESSMSQEATGFIPKMQGLFSNIFGGEGGLMSTIGSLFSSIAGAFGGGSGGGGGFFSALGGLLGGRAAGGTVSAGSLYKVNEIKPEILSVGNSDYLMMGNKSGRVEANPVFAGNNKSVNQVNNFTINGRIDRRTETQIASDVGLRTNRAMQRNS